MNRVVRCVPWAALVLTAAVAGHIPAADQTPPTPSVDDLIRDLGSPVFVTREKAGEQLWRHGRAAVPALEKAAADPNPEVARRARAVLARFSWYAFPDTPPDVLKQVAVFRAGTPDERKAALAALLKLGPHGRAAARAVFTKNLPPDTRAPLAAHLTTLLRREVPLLLYAGKPDEAADLLALHAAGTTPEGAADFAAFQVLRGTLPAAIAAAEAARKTAREPDAADLLLAHLYRASGDWAKARAAAAAIDQANTDREAADPDRTPAPGLVRMLLEEQGNWPALLAAPPTRANLPDAYRLTFLRLAGRQKEFDAEAAQVRKSVGELTNAEDVRDAAYSLLLNHRAADATDLLTERRQNPGLLAELLIARLRYKDALALIAPEPEQFPDPPGAVPQPAQPTGQREEFDLRRARVLALVGRRDEAVKLFTEVAGRIQAFRDLDDITPDRRVLALLRSELRVGLRDLACDHAESVLSGPQRPHDQEQGETLFDVLFGADAVAAKYLHRMVRLTTKTTDPSVTQMRRVRELLNGTAPKDVTDAVIQHLSQGPEPVVTLDVTMPTSLIRVMRLTALTAVCRAAKRYAEAEAAFAAAAEAPADGPELVGARTWVFGTSDAARPWVEYADFLADRGRFADAAIKAEAGWQRFPDQPLLLFLSGRALVKAGNPAEGRRRMELAHWVGLGNERARGKFLDELVRRGEAAAATRETGLLLRACWSRDFYFGNVMNQAAKASALGKDWPTAERCVQRSLLVLVKTPGVQFVDPSAYLNVPHEMLAFRARGRLAAGDVGGAMAAARACFDVTPGHVELAVGLVPALETLGRKAEADEVFGRVRDAYRAVLADYPDSAWAKNALAALGAGCRRELDRSREYAKAAVAADPKSVAFRETLAEVQFRRGDRAAAVALMTALAGENPRSHLYRRQLARYRSGDAASPTPDVEE